MPKFDLVLSYQNLDIENFEQLEAILDFVPNAEVSCIDGQTRLRAIREAASANEAVISLVEAVHNGSSKAVPDAVRFDLVSISELADAVGMNREAVRLWTIGKRGPGGFPLPVDVVGDRIKVWAAADVWEWLTKHSMPHPEARPLTMAEVVDGSRAVERLKARWASRPTILDDASWRHAKHEEATVRVGHPHAVASPSF